MADQIASLHTYPFFLQLQQVPRPSRAVRGQRRACGPIRRDDVRSDQPGRGCSAGQKEARGEGDLRGWFNHDGQSAPDDARPL